MSKKKTKVELEAEVRFLRGHNTSLVVSNAINSLSKWVGLVLISYFIYLSVDSLAGRTTDANIAVDFLAKIRASEVLAWIFGAGGVGYGVRQKKLRKDTTERLSDNTAEREAKADPKRTSSGLTKRGDTHPKDKK